MAAPPLEEFLAGSDAAWLTSGRVLVPGCGSGHDVRALAATGAEVVGLDISETAIATAREQAPVANETYRCADFFAGDHGSYDALWEHTCFCAIDPDRRDDYAAAAAAAVRPGGYLVGVFFINPWDADETAEPPPFGATREAIIGHLAPGFEWIDGRVPSRAFPGREGREWLAWFQRH